MPLGPLDVALSPPLPPGVRATAERRHPRSESSRSVGVHHFREWPRSSSSDGAALSHRQPCVTLRTDHATALRAKPWRIHPANLAFYRQIRGSDVASQPVMARSSHVKQPERRILALCAAMQHPALQIDVYPRWINSIDTPCGAVRNAIRTPGRMVFGSIVNGTPLAFSSVTAPSMSSTVSPK